MPSSWAFCQIICGLIWYWLESSEGSPLVSVSNSEAAGGGAAGPADSIGAEGAVEESEPADAAGELAAAGRATAAGVAASTDFIPRWGSSQECWWTRASTPALGQSSIWTACGRPGQNDNRESDPAAGMAAASACASTRA